MCENNSISFTSQKQRKKWIINLQLVEKQIL